MIITEVGISFNDIYEYRSHCLRTANEYLKGQATAREAIRLLPHDGLFSSLLSGEIAVEEATKAGIDYASGWLSFARNKLDKVVENSYINDEKDEAYAARAALRLTQLEVLDSIYSHHQMPTEDQVFDMYINIGKLGVELLDKRKIDENNQYHTMSNIKGVLGEMAVLLLIDRYALNDIGPDSFVALQSILSEDHGGDCLHYDSSPAWDINILTRLSLEEAIEKTYRLQIKNSKFYCPNMKRNDLFVTNVFLDPDLAVDKHELKIPEKIIRGCNVELNYPVSVERLSSELDKRQEQLLEIIG